MIELLTCELAWETQWLLVERVLLSGEGGATAEFSLPPPFPPAPIRSGFMCYACAHNGHFCLLFHSNRGGGSYFALVRQTRVIEKRKEDTSTCSYKFSAS